VVKVIWQKGCIAAPFPLKIAPGGVDLI